MNSSNEQMDEQDQSFSDKNENISKSEGTEPEHDTLAMENI